MYIYIHVAQGFPLRQAFAVVVRALNDPDLDVRREAVAALGDATWRSDHRMVREFLGEKSSAPGMN